MREREKCCLGSGRSLSGGEREKEAVDLLRGGGLVESLPSVLNLLLLL